MQVTDALTVPALKTIAADLNIKITSKMRKIEIISAINAMMDDLHAQADEMDLNIKINELFDVYSPPIVEEIDNDYRASLIKAVVPFAGMRKSKHKSAIKRQKYFSRKLARR